MVLSKPPLNNHNSLQETSPKPELLIFFRLSKHINSYSVIGSISQNLLYSRIQNYFIECRRVSNLICRDLKTLFTP